MEDMDMAMVMVWPSLEPEFIVVPVSAVDSNTVLEPLPPSRVVPPAWDLVVLVPAMLLVRRRRLVLLEFSRSSLVVRIYVPNLNFLLAQQSDVSILNNRSSCRSLWWQV